MLTSWLGQTHLTGNDVGDLFRWVGSVEGIVIEDRGRLRRLERESRITLDLRL